MFWPTPYWECWVGGEPLLVSCWWVGLPAWESRFSPTASLSLFLPSLFWASLVLQPALLLFTFTGSTAQMNPHSHVGQTVRHLTHPAETNPYVCPVLRFFRPPWDRQPWAWSQWEHVWAESLPRLLSCWGTSMKIFSSPSLGYWAWQQVY